MSFGGFLLNTAASQIPGLSTITSLAKDPLGAIFGKHSVYNFNPWHPPGDWRGKGERQKWEAQRRALGYPPYTTSMGREFKEWQARGGTVKDFVPGILQKTSPVMPGGAVVTSSMSGYSATPSAAPGSGAGAPRKRRKRRAVARKKAGRRKAGTRRRTRSRKRKLKFGSPAWRRRYLGHR